MFYVGQKVECVKPGNPLWGGKFRAVVGGIYTIRAIYTSPLDGGEGLLFNEMSNPIHPFHQVEYGYRSERFRPIQERKTDIGFAHEILRKVTKRKPATV